MLYTLIVFLSKKRGAVSVNNNLGSINMCKVNCEKITQRKKRGNIRK